MTLPFDELNNLIERYRIPFLAEIDRKTVEDEIEDLLILAYVYGVESVNDELGVSIDTNTDKADAIINRPVAGKTYKQRIGEYFDRAYEQDGAVVVSVGQQLDLLIDAVLRIAETETTRVYNESLLEAAGEAQLRESMKRTGNPRQAMKEWVTMADERVRDTHAFLHGTTIPLTEKFWTYDGDEALAPGMFGKAQNNVNCRCYLNFIWA